MRKNLPNIIIDEKGISLRYKPVNSGGGSTKIPFRSSRAEHGRYIERQLEEAWQKAKEQDAERKAVAATIRGGVYLQVKGQEGFDLITKSLEASNQKVRLLNVKDEDPIFATIYIPNNKKDFLLKKINKYVGEEKGQPVIDTIESITLAILEESFWIGDKSDIPKEESKWCEVWLRYDVNENVDQILDEFHAISKAEEIESKGDYIIFPERIVTVVNANVKQLQTLILASSRIAEIRKLPVSAIFFKELTNSEQKEWAKDLANRVDFSERTNVVVCLLDTGVNNGHILLENMLDDKDAYSGTSGRQIRKHPNRFFFDLDYSARVIERFPHMERENPRLADRFANIVDQAYEWGTDNGLSDEEFKDLIAKALDKWLA